MQPEIRIWHRRSPPAALAGTTAISAGFQNLKKFFHLGVDHVKTYPDTKQWVSKWALG